jgi:hypothetical protein
MAHSKTPIPAWPGKANGAAHRAGIGASRAASFNIDHARAIRHRRNDAAPPGDQLAGQLLVARTGIGTASSRRRA